MSVESFVIVDRKNTEKLVPVLLYVGGLFRRNAICASLSFLSICHRDCRDRIRFTGILSAGNETRCLQLLDELIGCYLNVERLPLTIQKNMGETAHEILAGMPLDYRPFLKGRLFEICGDYRFQSYWDTLENASCTEIFSNYERGALSALHLKKSTDFAALIIALAVLHGCGDEYYERIAALETSLEKKFGRGLPVERPSLYFWPLDFSFIEEDNDPAREHHALLEAVRTINADAIVQVCTDALLWPRDVIAWISDDFDAFVAPADALSGRFACGLPDEGGNIITGTAHDKFVLVSQGSFSDCMSEVVFRYEMDRRNIRTYTLPDGFLWSRNPGTGNDHALDSIHIDTVINFVPAHDTVDGKPKLIIDPCYHAMVRNDPEFNGFLRDQSLAETDIVVVDEREQYLNLPNFSVLLDPEGNRKFLFNKDRGFTIPRLKLKAGLMIQPAVEITRMASFFGSLRCATNMLPCSYVKERGTLTIDISDALPSETAEHLAGAFNAGTPIVRALSTLFVSHCVIQPGPGEIRWEYDEFSQTAYFYLSPDLAVDPEASCRSIGERIPPFAGMLGQRLGIAIEPDLIRGLNE